MSGDDAAFEQRAHELAAEAGITLDREECPPEWSDFMDAARSDVLLQRGIAHIRTKGLPEELSDYLARTWITHVETFERCRTEGEVTMAASWARRHAKVAAAVLAMPPLGVSGEDRSEPTPAPAPERQWAVEHPDVLLSVHRSGWSVLFTLSKLPGGRIVYRDAPDQPWTPETACLCVTVPDTGHYAGCPGTSAAVTPEGPA